MGINFRNLKQRFFARINFREFSKIEYFEALNFREFASFFRITFFICFA